MNDVILKAIITEKSMTQAAKGWYTFAVSKDSNKYQVSQAVKDQFKVHPVVVRTQIIKGKTVRTGKKRLLSKTAAWKKALVQLKDKEKIALFEVGEAPAK